MYSSFKSLYNNFKFNNSSKPSELFNIRYEEDWPYNNRFNDGFVPSRWSKDQKFYWTGNCNYGIPTRNAINYSSCPYGTGEYKNAVGYAKYRGYDTKLDNRTDTSLASQYGKHAQKYFGDDCGYGYKLLCPYQEDSVKKQYAPFDRNRRFQLSEYY
jgi:hypothetical protein